MRSTATGLFVLALALGAAWAESDKKLENQVAQCGFTLSEAIAKGAAEAGEGVVVKVELEDKDGTVVYGLDIAQGTGILDLALDAKEGKVVEKEKDEKEDHSEIVKMSKITLAQAVDAALKDSPGKAVYATLRMKDGKPRAMVRVLAAGKVKTVLLDAEAGTVLPADKDKEEADEDEGNEDKEEPGEDKEEDEDQKKTGAGNHADDAFTDAFGEDNADLGPTGRNPYFILEPGYVLELKGKDGDEEVASTITVTDRTKMIAGVETRVVEEKETVNGEIEEITMDYFAISKRTNNVYYFGEDVDVYEDGKVAHHEGAWLAGENGARYGLMMPGVPLLQSLFMQEIAPGVALDRCEIVSLSEKFESPAGKFEGVLKTLESSGLKKHEREFKHYARGVGLLQDGGLKLVKYGKVEKVGK